MSDERLRVRLVQAGYQEEVVGQLAKYMADEEERTLAAVEVQERAAVSYTHLTLPTIYSV